MMYLLLSVAGHLTIFQTRTRGPWWSIRPARILLLAVVGTQTLATLICIFGFLVTPLWWGWAAFVWGYALLWFLVTDPIKLLAYRALDATKAESERSKSDTKTEPKPADAKPVAKAALQPNAKADDSKPHPKVEAKSADAKPVAQAPPQSEAKADDAKSDAKIESKPDAKAGPAREAKPAPKSEAKAAPVANAEPKPADNTDAAKLLNMKFGEVLLAGLAKDPEDAGRVIAAAIAGAMSPSAAAKSPEVGAEPKSATGPDTNDASQPAAKAKTHDSTPSVAE